MMDKNSGYVGWSMSKRAAAAYAEGEMPKSRWTKEAMLAAIAEALDDEGIELTAEQMSNLEKMPKSIMFNRYFWRSSWHHTSKFCNVTDFYELWRERLFSDAEESTFEVYYALRISGGRYHVDKLFTSIKSVRSWFERNGFAGRKAKSGTWKRGGLWFRLAIGVR